MPLGDFPPVAQYRKMLSEMKDISDFKKLDKNLVYEMDRVMTHDIPLLVIQPFFYVISSTFPLCHDLFVLYPVEID